MGSLFKRGSAWWSQVHVSGVAVRESCRTKDKAEAKRILRERETQVVRGERPVRGKATWLEASAELLAWYRAYGSQDVREAGYRVRHLDQYFATYKLAEIDAAVITGYVVKRRGQGIAPGTIGIGLATLRKALKLAHEHGKLGNVPAIRAPKPAPPRPGFVERHELEAICQELPDALELVVRLAFTGPFLSTVGS